MEARDAAAVASLHVRSWQVAYRGQLPDAFLDALTEEIEQRTQRWRGHVADASSRGWTQLVAEDGDRVVGFVSFGPPQDRSLDPSVGELYAIYLDPDHWGRGYGRALMAAAVSGLTERGYSEAILWVLESNARTRRFYEIAGWVPDGSTKTEHRGEVTLREMRYRRPLHRGDPAGG